MITNYEDVVVRYNELQVFDPPRVGGSGGKSKSQMPLSVNAMDLRLELEKAAGFVTKWQISDLCHADESMNTYFADWLARAKTVLEGDEDRDRPQYGATCLGCGSAAVQDESGMSPAIVLGSLHIEERGSLRAVWCRACGWWAEIPDSVPRS